MSIIRCKCRELKDLEVKPVPKVKKPRLTAVQLSLFDGGIEPSLTAWPTRHAA